MTDRAVLAVMTLVVGLFLTLDLRAQECVPDTGPGAELPGSHDGVIPPGQNTVDITWTPPLYTADCDLLDTDPALAVTAYDVYIWNEPGTPASSPVLTLPPDATSTTAPIQTEGKRLYVMLRACNETGCGIWSPQIVKVIAGKPRQLEISVTVTPGG